MKAIRIAFTLLAIALVGQSTARAQDPLPSWNDSPTKQAIVDFVRATTETGGAKFVPPEERIATFDQDGTLWVEHPNLLAVYLLPGPRAGAGRREAGIKERRTIQNCA